MRAVFFIFTRHCCLLLWSMVTESFEYALSDMWCDRVWGTWGATSQGCNTSPFLPSPMHQTPSKSSRPSGLLNIKWLWKSLGEVQHLGGYLFVFHPNDGRGSRGGLNIACLCHSALLVHLITRWCLSHIFGLGSFAAENQRIASHVSYICFIYAKPNQTWLCMPRFSICPDRKRKG